MNHHDALILMLFISLLALRYAVKILRDCINEHETRIDASLNRIRTLETEVRYLRQRDAELSIALKESRPC